MPAIFLVTAVLALWVGCNSNHSTGLKPPVPKRITEIFVNEDAESWSCAIKGNQPLTFMAFNQVSPTGLALYFPDTALDVARTIPIPPDNEIFKSIEADEVFDGDIKNSRLSIVLQVERPYALSPDQDGVKISFPKTTARRENTDAEMLPAAGDNEIGRGVKDLADATVLENVTATSLKDHIIVNVNADGTIADYTSFAIENPARIVFDIHNLKSRYEKEQSISVASRWVKQIRYFAYPERIRLVLDTEPEFLSQYFSFPTASGLLIYVGRTPQPLDKKG
ncbi:MAG: AMIN domain-containing protein [Desulfobacterales bacterium]|nr:MAG: AMIN domain-containing protein [Desulfobacterales bacterium]